MVFEENVRRTGMVSSEVKRPIKYGKLQEVCVRVNVSGMTCVVEFLRNVIIMRSSNHCSW